MRILSWNVNGITACIERGDFNATMSERDIFAGNSRMEEEQKGYISDERSGLHRLVEAGFCDAYRHFYPRTSPGRSRQDAIVAVENLPQSAAAGHLLRLAGHRHPKDQPALDEPGDPFQAV